MHRNRNQLSPGFTTGQTRSAAGLLEILVTIAIVAILIALFLPATRSAREPARRSQCKNNLKQIGLALYNYQEEHGALPPAYTVDENGKPLHSWRTLILPYLYQKPLYDSIDLSKPWNDPANAKAYATVLPAYACPSTELPESHTTYLALVGSECSFHPTEPRTFKDFADGKSSTAWVIDASMGEAVHWMDPRDSGNQFFLNFNDKSQLSHAGGIQVLLSDGSARFVSAQVRNETRRALLTIAGGESIGEF